MVRVLEQETAKGIDTLAAKTQEVMEQESRLPGGQALEYRLNPPAALVTGNQNGKLSGRNDPYGIIDTRQPVGYDKGKEGGGNELSPAGRGWGQPNRTNIGRPNAYAEYLAYKQKVQARQQSLALEQALRELVERVYAGPQAFAYNGADGFANSGYETGGAAGAGDTGSSGGINGGYAAGDLAGTGGLDGGADADRASSVGDTSEATGQVLSEGGSGTDELILKGTEYSLEYARKLKNTYKIIRSNGYEISEHGLNRILGRINQGKIESIEAVLDVIKSGTKYVDTINGGTILYKNKISIHIADDGFIRTVIGNARIKSTWEIMN